ncbi:MAG TPA: ribosome-associated translation inhibitor RaiA [Nitrosopumilaceae archaeon]|jgi:putative sigma-54 modulation protein|nr:ribosome-associated translation inhibitor RaiA [Nitrosopumilaceae archaeon]
MTINIQSVHFDADRKLLDFANEKINKLTQYYDNIIDCDVIFKIDNTSSSDNKITEIKLRVRGQELFAKKKCASFEEAIDTAIVALKTQLQKHKEKAMAKHQ